MKAFIVDRHGGPDVVRAGEMPEPEVRNDDVLVEIHAAGMNQLDMKASGDQLREISSLIDAGVVRPVVDRVFPFEAANEALAYVETGRAKGKVVIKVR